MKKLIMASFVIVAVCVLSAQEALVDFTSLEFETSGVSVEVPSDWYAMNNDSLRLIKQLVITEQKGEDPQSRLLISLMDSGDLYDKNASLLNIQFIPEHIVSQDELANATPEQADVLFDLLESIGFEELRKLAYRAHLIDKGKIVQKGENWYAILEMSVQMRADLPEKTKEMYFYLSRRGTVIIAFTYLKSESERIVEIRDYVTESLRTNTIKRSK